MSDWTSFTEQGVLAALPPALKNLHSSWVEANPAKSSRLAELVADTITLFRTSVATQPAILIPDDPTLIPVTGELHAFNLVAFNLCMEMDVQFAPEVYTLFVQSQVWLRMVQSGSLKPVPWSLTDSVTSSPSFSVHRRSLSEFAIKEML